MFSALSDTKELHANSVFDRPHRFCLVLYLFRAGAADEHHRERRFFSHKFAIPTALAGAAGQVESFVGLSTPQLLALLSGAIELAAGLLLAFNVGTRAMAIVLILFSALAIYYGNDFWHMTGAERDQNLVFAALRVSLIGGLLVFAALGSSWPAELERRADV
jgi:uncharacterized membrane protein YphA (DoxX/SURF4 family)